MRLLLVTNDFPPKQGGIQQYLESLVRHMPGEVLVLAPASPNAPEVPGVVRYRRRFMWPTPAVARWIERHVGQFRPDVVLFGAPLPLSPLGASLRRTTGVGFGVLCHGAEITVPAAVPVLRTVLRRSLRAADAVFAVSRFTQRTVGRLTGRLATYVGAGVDVERFTPDPDGSRTSGPIVVGCVSRFVPRKGQHRVIDAVAALRGAGLDVTLTLVGSGRKEQRLRRRAEVRDVPTDFRIAVPWPDLPAVYRTMDVFAMPCRTRWAGLEVEGLGLVFLEAAASGVPVVAGDSGGAPETVVPGRTGYVASSVAGLVDAIRAVIERPDRGSEMGLAGRKMVERDYVWPAVADRLVRGFADAPPRVAGDS